MPGDERGGCVTQRQGSVESIIGGLVEIRLSVCVRDTSTRSQPIRARQRRSLNFLGEAVGEFALRKVFRPR